MTTNLLITLLLIGVALIFLAIFLIRKSYNVEFKKATLFFVPGVISLLISLVLLLGSTGAFFAPVCPNCNLHMDLNYCSICGHEFYQERDKENECAICHNYLNKEAKYCKVCGAER